MSDQLYNDLVNAIGNDWPEYKTDQLIRDNLQLLSPGAVTPTTYALKKEIWTARLPSTNSSFIGFFSPPLPQNRITFKRRSGGFHTVSFTLHLRKDCMLGLKSLIMPEQWMWESDPSDYVKTGHPLQKHFPWDGVSDRVFAFKIEKMKTDFPYEWGRECFTVRDIIPVMEPVYNLLDPKIRRAIPAARELIDGLHWDAPRVANWVRAPGEPNMDDLRMGRYYYPRKSDRVCAS